MAWYVAPRVAPVPARVGPCEFGDFGAIGGRALPRGSTR